jgi:hypothetical protein
MTRADDTQSDCRVSSAVSALDHDPKVPQIA